MLIQWLRREMLRPYHEADPGTPTGGTGETPPAPTPDAAQEPADDFDKDRAMRTIEKLRSFEKDAKAKLKRLEELETQEQQRTEKDLSEAEKLKKQLAELQASHAEAQARLKRSALLDAARSAADKAALVFHPGALEDALALGAFDDLEWNDKGEPLDIGKAVRTLASARPYLLKPAATSADLDGARRGASNKTEEEADRRTRLAQRWGFRNQG